MTGAIFMRALLFLLLALVSGCAQPDARPAETVATYVYRIGPGDRLKVLTYGEDKLSGEFTVNSKGELAIPLLSPVPAAGKTLDELRTLVAQQLSVELLRNPRVTVEVINYRPVYILGEVNRAGEYTYSERMTVFALVAKAGGFSYRADQKYAYIRHDNEAAEIAYELTSGTVIRPGDTVRIGERYF